ncbi:F-box protein CPR1-like [Papaver somniferum]|uniref:F-box protein CPR1-like n=1 Tax=Papaver somniferum TaxID=3469 RepID=UPI000E6F8527|nr:F-box protein CPR1-like [Papaver somniferum]
MRVCGILSEDEILNSGGGERGRKRKAELSDGESNTMKPLPRGGITSETPSSFNNIHICGGSFGQQLGDDAVADDTVSFLFLTVQEKSRLYYGEYDESSKPCMELEIVNHPHIKKRFGTSEMVGSCNGLVCFSIPYTYEVDDPIYICNPNTGEQISLPRFTAMSKNKNNVEFKKTTYLDGHIVSGFGYNSVTDEYKVVRIYYAESQSLDQPKGQVQVYTLGSGSGWRNVGECPYSLLRFDLSDHVRACCVPYSNRSAIHIPTRGVLTNGALHWFDEDWNVAAFNLADEKFSMLPSPPCFCPGEKKFYVLQVLQGCLCVVNDQNGKSLDIWSFKKESNEWAKMFGISCQSDKFIDVYWPISLTPSELLFAPLPWPLIEAIPHVNSSVSLKALGEKSKKIVRAVDIDDYDLISD